MIPEHKIQEVLERVDLVALISRHVELKKSGRSFKGRCPFHQEKSASFYVTPEMKRFKCFGCQAGGDAIAFIQRYLGKTFVDSVRDLAKEAGVDLESAQDPSARERQQIKEATDLAAEHFKGCLWDEEKGRNARAYLESRGVTEDVSRNFGLGWAPAAWSELSDKLRQAGMLEFGVKAGLCQERQKQDGYYDMFRGRLIIPIRSPEGRTIAFGGRLLEGEDGPKYLNSRESRLYNKSETLYGMDQAREEIRKRKSVVLVEGYFDCIGLHQAGVRNAVALCSTALTSGHLAALSRAEAKELVLLLDGDEAGRKAVERLCGPLLATGTASKVALLPEGEDPDTFARKVGSEAVGQLVAEARPLTEHLFQTVLPEGKTASFEDKMMAVDRLKPVTSQIPVGLTRSAFFSALASHTGLPASELEATLRGKTPTVKAVPKPGSLAPQVWQEPSPTRPIRPPAPERPPDRLEAWYVAAVLKEPRLQAKDTFRVGDELSHTGLRSALAHFNSGATPEDALFEASPPVKAALTAAAQDLRGSEAELELTFEKTCRKLALRRVDERLSHIAKVAGQLEGASELTDDTRKLMTERIGLLELRKQVTEAQTPGPKGRK